MRFLPLLRPPFIQCLCAGAGIGFACLAADARADEPAPATTRLKSLTLEQLLEVKVISTSRFPEEWKSAPDALAVVPSEDIRRSGTVRLADVLRGTPGLDVARFSAGSYAISARGFNTTSSNKMQVMMDGRSLYTPLFSGVFWEVQDTLLEDLDRIEVVRGPGATLWGSNAVDGVINIVTKNARETQGAFVTFGGGNEEQVFGAVRYGGKIADQTYYRVYFKHLERDDQRFSNGTSAADAMTQTQGGFRLDSALANDASATLQGDLYGNRFGIAGRPDAENAGGNLLGRWSRAFSPDSQFQLQAYFDWARRDVPLQFREVRKTWDLDLQQHFKIGERQHLVFGGSYRSSADETAQTGRTFTFIPPSRTLGSLGGFVQDQIALVPAALTLYAGAKFERNDFTGWEIQPNLRLAYAPTSRQLAWVAVSRAVRSPTRADADSRFIPAPSTGFVTIQGNPDFRSENLIAYEAGYRVELHGNVFADLALFRNQYDRLRTLEPQPVTVFPLSIRNEREGDTYGGEFSLTYQAAPTWRLTGSYSYLHENLRFKPGSHDPTNGTIEGNDPSHLATLRSTLDLPGNVEFDCAFRYVSSRPNPRIPGYLATDVRLAFRPREGFELALVGRNLFDPRHPEFAGTPQPEVERSFFVQLTFRH